MSKTSLLINPWIPSAWSQLNNLHSRESIRKYPPISSDAGDAEKDLIFLLIAPIYITKLEFVKF